MSTETEKQDLGRSRRRAPWYSKLTAKVLVLAAVFLMIGEMLVFVPSIANFRINWLQQRSATAEIAALAVEAARNQEISPLLRKELLERAGVLVLAVRTDDARQLVLIPDRPPIVEASYDLRDDTPMVAIYDAFTTLFHGGNRVISVMNKPSSMSATLIEMALDEKPLFQAMVRYSINILTLSIFLAVILAALLFFALNRLLVRPVQRLSGNMQAFALNPEDRSRIIEPTGRVDEIGAAEQELKQMQTELSDLLSQKSRLASLGLAVSKVSHDLRNMLASAQLISDRLGMVDDPTVKKFAPKLIASLDRAIGFCQDTLKFGRAQEAPPRREMFNLRALVDEVLDHSTTEAGSDVVFYNEVAADLDADADREQLFRVLMNLLRNAAEAVESKDATSIARGSGGKVRVRARHEDSHCIIEVTDNGPGVPEKAKEHLFEAFRGSQRQGGTGLGLAIASELVRAHGGAVRLVESPEPGTVFQISIPDRLQEVESGRRGKRSA
ncbi:MAG: HAMP domain-containing sensor histidine kinase [Pseudomonadota bacterium]